MKILDHTPFEDHAHKATVSVTVWRKTAGEIKICYQKQVPLVRFYSQIQVRYSLVDLSLEVGAQASCPANEMSRIDLYY